MLDFKRRTVLEFKNPAALKMLVCQGAADILGQVFETGDKTTKSRVKQNAFPLARGARAKLRIFEKPIRVRTMGTCNRWCGSAHRLSSEPWTLLTKYGCGGRMHFYEREATMPERTGDDL